MIEQDRAQARANLVWTYSELARQVPGSELQPLGDGWLCRAPHDMPFCNFGIGLGVDLDPSSTVDLKATVQFQLPNQSFRIFCLTEGEHPVRNQTMAQFGFRSTSRICHLKSAQAQGPMLKPEEVIDPTSRLELASFMAKQFFWRQPEHQRRRIAEATARSGHRLFRVDQNGILLGGWMLTETPQAMGLYNVCVGLEQRGRGLGRSMVRTAQAQAQEAGRPLFLQCDPALRRWYEALGFESQGQIETFSKNSS